MEALYRLRLDGDQIVDEKIASADVASPGDILAHEEKIRVVGRGHIAKLRTYTIVDRIAHRTWTSRTYERRMAGWSRLSMEIVKAMLRANPETRIEIIGFADDHGMDIDEIVKEANRRGLKDIKDIVGIMLLLDT